MIQSLKIYQNNRDLLKIFNNFNKNGLNLYLIKQIIIFTKLNVTIEKTPTDYSPFPY